MREPMNHPKGALAQGREEVREVRDMQQQ